jgi:cell wall assembly regulator SMI1
MRIEQIGGWGEAHFREPAAQEAIKSVEASLGHPLPRELRELLNETDGIEGEHGPGLLWTAQRIASDNLSFRPNTEFADLYMPFAGLVFFADAGNGDQFFISLSGNNEVYAWDHESDSRTWVAATVLGYLEGWMRGDLTI